MTKFSAILKGIDTPALDDVRIKQLVTHSDQRGYFRELVREDDEFFEGFGQWSVSKMFTGVIKAWHIHDLQYDFWHVPIGAALAVLADLRADSPTYLKVQEFLMGDDQPPIILKIPPGIAHGIKILEGPAYLFYITSHVYNPKDEGRLDHKDAVIGYDWLKQDIT